MKREIVLESGVCFYSSVSGIEQALKLVIEQSSNGQSSALRVKLPVGFVDAPTLNGNHYEASEVQRALDVVKEDMSQGKIHGAHGDHPVGRVYINPDEISHLIIDAWIDKETLIPNLDGDLVPSFWNEWLVIPTEKGGGKDLIELFKAGASVGTSYQRDCSKRRWEVYEAVRVLGYGYGRTSSSSGISWDKEF